MSAIPPWTCPTCKLAVSSAFCPTCGERQLSKHDLTLAGLLAQALHTVSSIDSRLLRSMRAVLLRPGALTVAWLDGSRKPYIAPLALFLLANVLFFAIQSLTGATVFSTPLASHLNVQDWHELAQTLVTQRLQNQQTTLAAYAPVFDQAVEVNAKSLVILMVVPFALVLIPMFFTNHRPFVTHLVFALHFYTYLLLILCGLMAVLYADALFGGDGMRSHGLDIGLFVALLISAAVHLFLAAGRVYRAAGLGRLVKVTLLTTAVAVGVLGYRFAIFLITLYWT